MNKWQQEIQRLPRETSMPWRRAFNQHLAYLEGGGASDYDIAKAVLGRDFQEKLFAGGESTTFEELAKECIDRANEVDVTKLDYDSSVRALEDACRALSHNQQFKEISKNGEAVK